MDNNIKEFKNVHFVGIGGIGMSGIASILLKENKQVSGSDLKNSSILDSLSKQGAKIYLGHSKDNIKSGIDFVIYSSAIPKDNVELIAAKSFGIPIVKRAQMLAYLMNSKKGIAVTGAHGKTTTTSLISHILIEAGLNPSAAIGGILRNLSDNAKVGNGDYFVIEADESDGSFLYYRPQFAVITNIDFEHMDYYKNWNNLIGAYEKFVSRLKPQGKIYACGDDRKLSSILRKYKDRVRFYGKSPKNDIYSSNIVMDKFWSYFEFNMHGKKFGKIKLPLAGEHNILNALAAISLCLELGVDFKTIVRIVENFKGAERRFQVRLSKPDVMVMEDYGHHPTEIKAVLKAAKNLGYKRLVAIFQPHRYTRTKLLLDEFANTFKLADSTIITDIYSAQEPEMIGVNGRMLCQRIKDTSCNDCIFLPKEKIHDFIFLNRKEGDLFLFLGAGDINKIACQLTQIL